MLEVGDQAPAFEALTDTGETVSLGDFRGQKVVLYFYPKDDTPGCTREACSFRDNYQAVLDRGAVILGVSADGVESHARFKQKYGLPFPLLADPDRRIIEAYGVWKERTASDGRMFMGIERTTFVIDEHGVIARVFPRVKVDGHTEDVLAALDQG
jgi:peroxiredoxin Q/BCP